MQQWIYNMMIGLYRVGISLATLFHRKARLWVQGRKKWDESLKKALSDNKSPILWVHAASLGEFEQGRPIIESIRANLDEVFILLTFFSPSGYEVRKDYDKVDHVMYLPLDTRSNARKFVNLLRPDVAVFIKYEFWFNHLQALRENGSKVYLASGRFYSKQGFFQSWGAWFRRGLGAFDHFYLQDKASAALLDSIELQNYTVNGDTRFDRVISIMEEAEEIPDVRDFVGGKPCIVLGSSWPQEEMRIMSFLDRHASEDFKVIIAPHEIKASRMASFEENSKSRVARLSTWNGEEVDVLFIDSIGQLAQVYRYASVAFIGGAFGEGLHNVLEPAVWSVPVIFGPRFQGFQEAVGLVEAGGAQVVESQEELDQVLLKLLSNKEAQSKMGRAASDFCKLHKGASKVVVDEIIRTLEEKI